MQKDSVFVNPNESDLMVTGYLDTIKINHTSFSVFYQLYLEEAAAISYLMLSKTFPLKFLPDFFRVNAESPVGFYCPRVPEVEPSKSIRQGAD